jgi:hypothetical protein
VTKPHLRLAFSTDVLASGYDIRTIQEPIARSDVATTIVDTVDRIPFNLLSVRDSVPGRRPAPDDSLALVMTTNDPDRSLSVRPTLRGMNWRVGGRTRKALMRPSVMGTRTGCRGPR